MTDDLRGKADIHIHTRHSGLTKVGFLRFPDSISDPKDVVKMAEKKGLDVICVTDHNTVRGALEAKKYASSVEVVLGSELATADGDLLGVFLTENMPIGLPADETIDLIHAQGGLAIAPHPFSSRCDSLGFKILDLQLDGIEFFNAAHRDAYTNDAAQRIAGHVHSASVGGSDAHFPTMVGNAYTMFDGSTAEDLRKAIVERRTSFKGESTPLRDLVWMTTRVAAELWFMLGKSMVRPLDRETEYSSIVSDMRIVSKVVSMIGATVFLVPPTPALATFLGDQIHRSRSKSHFLRIVSASDRR